MAPRLIPLDEQPGLADRMNPLIEAAWPAFMLQDPIGNQHWGRLYSTFGAFQVALVDGDRVIGQGNTIPICWEEATDEMPDEGWDWAFLHGVEGADAGVEPTMLVGLQVVIDPSAQGRGLSTAFVDHFRRLAVDRDFDRLVIPIRPTLKSRYPLTPIDDYLHWTTQAGEPFDPWLRVHARAGARIVKACPQSMTIRGSVAEWEDWAEMAFPASGEFVVPGALTPVTIDRERDEGVYLEPNIWVEHRLR